MSITTYGFGLNPEVSGGFAAYGFGILELIEEQIIVIASSIVNREIREFRIESDIRGIKIYKEDN